MYYRQSTITELKNANVSDGELYLWFDDLFINIDREDIEKSPSKYITIVDYINATIQDIEPK